MSRTDRTDRTDKGKSGDSTVQGDGWLKAKAVVMSVLALAAAITPWWLLLPMTSLPMISLAVGLSVVAIIGSIYWIYPCFFDWLKEPDPIKNSEYLRFEKGYYYFFDSEDDQIKITLWDRLVFLSMLCCAALSGLTTYVLIRHFWLQAPPVVLISSVVLVALVFLDRIYSTYHDGCNQAERCHYLAFMRYFWLPFLCLGAVSLYVGIGSSYAWHFLTLPVATVFMGVGLAFIGCASLIYAVGSSPARENDPSLDSKPYRYDVSTLPYRDYIPTFSFIGFFTLGGVVALTMGFLHYYSALPIGASMSYDLWTLGGVSLLIAAVLCAFYYFDRQPHMLDSKPIGADVLRKPIHPWIKFFFRLYLKSRYSNHEVFHDGLNRRNPLERLYFNKLEADYLALSAEGKKQLFGVRKEYCRHKQKLESWMQCPLSGIYLVVNNPDQKGRLALDNHRSSEPKQVAKKWGVLYHYSVLSLWAGIRHVKMDYGTDILDNEDDSSDEDNIDTGAKERSLGHFWKCCQKYRHDLDSCCQDQSTSRPDSKKAEEKSSVIEMPEHSSTLVEGAVIRGGSVGCKSETFVPEPGLARNLEASIRGDSKPNGSHSTCGKGADREGLGGADGKKKEPHGNQDYVLVGSNGAFLVRKGNRANATNTKPGPLNHDGRAAQKKQQGRQPPYHGEFRCGGSNGTFMVGPQQKGKEGDHRLGGGRGRS